MTKEELQKLAVDAHARARWAVTECENAIKAAQRAAAHAQDAEEWAEKLRLALCVPE